MPTLFLLAPRANLLDSLRRRRLNKKPDLTVPVDEYRDQIFGTLDDVLVFAGRTCGDAVGLVEDADGSFAEGVDVSVVYGVIQRRTGGKLSFAYATAQDDHAVKMWRLSRVTHHAF